MELKVTNVNYNAIVADVKQIIQLDNCDNVQAAIVSGYQVIVSKNTNIGDIGLFFPVECKLSPDYLKNNNLYQKSEMNLDVTQKGYFSENGRVRCVKFRGNKSEGLFMPLTSLNYICNVSDLKLNDCFNEIDGKEICNKYIIKEKNTNVQLSKSDKKKKKVDKIPRLVENQFRLHIDTEQLKRNMFKINPESIISISSKWHGSSFVSSNVLVNRKLTLIDKIAKFFGANVKTTEYGNVYSSRNVVKNAYHENAKDNPGFYSKDIWKIVNDHVKDLIPKGFSLYGEIVGYVDKDSFIQKGYSYGCENGECELFVYRITFTNEDGKVFELTWTEIVEFCEKYGIKHVPLFFYGKAKDIYPDIPVDENWHSALLARLEKDESMFMNDTMCPYNSNKVPAEGIVLRIEKMFDPSPFKLKNYKFLMRESAELDAGNSDMESEN